MNWNVVTLQDFGIDQYQRTLERTCKECGLKYTIGEYLEHSSHHFQRPENYRSGCETYCLACWLGVGPNDFPIDEGDTEFTKSLVATSGAAELNVGTDLDIAIDNELWPYEEIYEQLVKGDLLTSFKWFLEGEPNANLAIMPVTRLDVNRTIVFPGAIVFYPTGVVKLNQLNLVADTSDNHFPGERCSLASGVTADVFKKQPLVVLPCRLNWQTFRSASHDVHLDIIRFLSEEIDRTCLNFARFQLCRLEPVDNLPGRPGQVASNFGMAGVLLYSGSLCEARIIGGSAFAHTLIRGMGMSLRQFEWEDLPQDGETGKVANHALGLYTALLESNNPTARFMQAMSLLEFLADPNDYQSFKEVKKIIARYIARDKTEYQRILDRFIELTGKKDPDTDKYTGYRTRVVHMGESIERIIPDSKTRRELFLELDGYIRPVIDHMISHSKMPFEQYLELRKTLGPQ